MIASTHCRHRATEFKKFLTKIDQNVPGDLDIHVVCDKYGTHKPPTVKAWLDKHPRFHMHSTPTYSSWINQVERLFAEMIRDLLQRSDHHSLQTLEKDLRAWIKARNDDPKPFAWTKTPTRSSHPSANSYNEPSTWDTSWRCFGGWCIRYKSDFSSNLCSNDNS